MWSPSASLSGRPGGRVATIQAAVIEFQHLVYFVAVAEEGSIRSAAHRLHLTQPPLSRHMRALEKRLGVQLFTRTPRGVLLTPAGEVLLVEARDTLSRLGHSLERVQRAAIGVRRIRFGYAGTAGADLIPGVIAAMARQTPAIDVELAELPAEKDARGVRPARMRRGVRAPLDRRGAGSGRRRRRRLRDAPLRAHGHGDAAGPPAGIGRDRRRRRLRGRGSDRDARRPRHHPRDERAGSTSVSGR